MSNEYSGCRIAPRKYLIQINRIALTIFSYLVFLVAVGSEMSAVAVDVEMTDAEALAKMEEIVLVAAQRPKARSREELYKNATQVQRRFILIDSFDTGYFEENTETEMKLYKKYSQEVSLRETDFLKLMNNIEFVENGNAKINLPEDWRSDDPFIRSLKLHYDSTTGQYVRDVLQWDETLINNLYDIGKNDDHYWIIRALRERAKTELHSTWKGKFSLADYLETSLLETQIITANMNYSVIDIHAIAGNASFGIQTNGNIELAQKYLKLAKSHKYTSEYNRFAAEMRGYILQAELGNFERAYIEAENTYKNITAYVQLKKLSADGGEKSWDYLIRSSVAHMAFFAAVIGKLEESEQYRKKLAQSGRSATSTYYTMMRILQNANVEDIELRKKYANKLMEYAYRNVLVEAETAFNTDQKISIGRELSLEEITEIMRGEDVGAGVVLDIAEKLNKGGEHWLMISQEREGKSYFETISSIQGGVNEEKILQRLVQGKMEIDPVVLSGFSEEIEGESIRVDEDWDPYKTLIVANRALAEKKYQIAYEGISLLEKEIVANSIEPDLAYEIELLKILYYAEEGDLVSAMTQSLEVQQKYGQQLSKNQHIRLLELSARVMRRFKVNSVANQILDPIFDNKDLDLEGLGVGLKNMRAQLLVETGQEEKASVFLDQYKEDVTDLGDGLEYDSIVLLNLGLFGDTDSFQDKYNSLAQFRKEEKDLGPIFKENLAKSDLIFKIRGSANSSTIINASRRELEEQFRTSFLQNKALQAKNEIDGEQLAAKQRSLIDQSQEVRGERTLKSTIIAILSLSFAMLAGCLIWVLLQLRRKDQELVEGRNELNEVHSSLTVAGRMSEFHFRQVKELLEDGDGRTGEGDRQVIKEKIEEVCGLWSNLGRISDYNNKQNISTRTISVEEIGDLATKEFRQINIRSKTKLAVNTFGYVDTICCDYYMVHSVIHSILKFMSRETYVGTIDLKIGVENKPDRLVLKFKDEGTGVNRIVRNINFENIWSEEGSSESIAVSVIANGVIAKGGTFDHEGVPGIGNTIHVTLPITITEQRKDKSAGNDNVIVLTSGH